MYHTTGATNQPRVQTVLMEYNIDSGPSLGNSMYEN